MSAELDIYNFEGLFEAAFAAVLRAKDLVVITSDHDVSSEDDKTQFQLPRPRLEIFFAHGAFSGGQLAVPSSFDSATQRPEPGECREASFTGQLVMEVITGTDRADHRLYVARVRNWMSTILPLVNETQLPLHKIQSLQTGGSNPMFKDTDNNLRTTLNFTLQYSVQNNAWTALESENE